MKKGLVFICIFIISFIIFAPKIFLFEKIEYLLNKEGVEIKNTNAKEYLFDMRVYDIKLSVKDIEILSSDLWSVKAFGFYNKIKMTQSNVQIMQLEAPSIDITYTLLEPLYINIKAQIKEGTINGYYNIYSQRGELSFSYEEGTVPSTIKKDFTKSEKGYVYAF